MSLYRDAHWWSRSDHDAVLSVMERLRPRRVLEFGPGSSTLALIEGGADIDTLEDDPVWVGPAAELLAPHRAMVRMIGYTWSDPLDIPQTNNNYQYALGFIDGPADTTRRPACIEYALDHCNAVLVALECAQGSKLLHDACIRLAEEHSCDIEIMVTGPLAGAFALLT